MHFRPAEKFEATGLSRMPGRLVKAQWRRKNKQSTYCDAMNRTRLFVHKTDYEEVGSVVLILHLSSWWKTRSGVTKPNSLALEMVQYWAK